MANWTTQSRTPLGWTAPPPVELVGEAYELLISDNFKLDIGGGFNLTIKPESVETVYTTSTKSTGSNNWPSTVVTEADRFLDIGNGFSLLISTEYKLIIDPEERGETNWTPITRTPLSF